MSDADVCVLASHPTSAAAITGESTSAMMIAIGRRLIIYLLSSTEGSVPHVACCSSSRLPFRSPPSFTCLDPSTGHNHRGFYEQLPFMAPVGQDHIRVPIAINIAELKITDADFDLWKMCTHHVGEFFRSVAQIELALSLKDLARSS